MDRCIVWGNGSDYEKIINQIKYEELKDNLKVIAIVAKLSEIFGEKRDGYPLISKEELKHIKYDVVIVASSKYYQEMELEAQNLGISEECIINGMAFMLPLFDYKRYMKLVKEPVTILSDDCWGVYIS